jgi:hypothetical protein
MTIPKTDWNTSCSAGSVRSYRIKTAIRKARWMRAETTSIDTSRERTRDTTCSKRS